MGPGQEPRFKVPGLSLICCVPTGNHLIFLNFGQNKEIKYLLSSHLWLLGRSQGRKRWKYLEKIIRREGCLLGVRVTHRILLTTPGFFFFNPFFLHCLLFWGVNSGGSSRGGEISAAEAHLSVPHSVKMGNHCFKQRTQRQSHVNIWLVQGGAWPSRGTSIFWCPGKRVPSFLLWNSLSWTQ